MTDKEHATNNFAKDINAPSKEQTNDSLKNQDKNFNENFTQEKEQIIIDGVDVSECLFYQSNFEEDYDVKIKHFCSNWHNSCESINNSNCYFKQLARKTQECEELKDSVDKIKNYVKNQMFDVDCKNWFDRFIYTFEDWKKSICEANDRYRKALEEIERELKEDIYCESQECGCDDYEECLRCTKNIILDIISKADFGKSERSETRLGESCVEPVEPPIIQEAKGEE